ncbi:SERTA domain-containing protein 3 [Marasmius crinis-equi]|uniref:SERTA domain-containing protein 3 n=1 Tax=Marasmius crinis-equi TaxID=585013 RepID=A0ABR3ESI2_9AGAR
MSEASPTPLSGTRALIAGTTQDMAPSPESSSSSARKFRDINDVDLLFPHAREPAFPGLSNNDTRTPNPEQLEGQESFDLEPERGDAMKEENQEGVKATKKTKGKKATKKATTKRSCGARSNFTEAQVAYFESKIPEYEALGKSKTRKTAFWLDFMPEFLKRFPEVAELKPTTRTRGDPSGGITQARLQSVDSGEQRALQKRVKRFHRISEERVTDAVKNTFNHLKRKHNTAQKTPCEAPLKKAQLSSGPASTRPGLPRFVAKCPKYKSQVVELSTETGHEARLQCRIADSQELMIATSSPEEPDDHVSSDNDKEDELEESSSEYRVDNGPIHRRYSTRSSTVTRPQGNAVSSPTLNNAFALAFGGASVPSVTEVLLSTAAPNTKTAPTAATHDSSASAATAPSTTTQTSTQVGSDGESFGMEVDDLDDVEKDVMEDKNGRVDIGADKRNDVVPDPIPDDFPSETDSNAADKSLGGNRSTEDRPSAAAAPKSLVAVLKDNATGAAVNLPSSFLNSDGDGVARQVPTQPVGRGITAEFFDSIVVPDLASDQIYLLDSVSNEFIRDLGKLLLEGELGVKSAWLAVVYQWIELEEKWQGFGFEEKALTTRLRPEVYKVWLKARRTTRPGGRKTPRGVSLPQFRQLWWGWLSEILPSECLRDGSNVVVVPQDYTQARALECPGKDGFSLLLMGLKWWHERGGEDEVDNVGRWVHAAKAVYRCMGLLLENLARKSPEPQDDHSPSSRRKAPDTAFDPTAQPHPKRRRTAQK